MLEFIEATPLPIECRRCVKQDCDECDYMGLRWRLTEESRIQLSHIIAVKKRLAKQKREQIRKRRRRY